MEKGDELVRKYGVVLRSHAAEINCVKGFLIWNYLLANEIGFQDMDQNFLSLFHSASAVKTEKKWKELIKQYGTNAKEHTLTPGDIVAVTRRRPGIPQYKHYAVYIGDDKVIHFADKKGDWGQNILVHEAPFSAFLKEAKEFEILDFDPVRSNPGAKRKLAILKGIFYGRMIPPYFAAGEIIVGISLLLELLEETAEKKKDKKYHLYSPEETVERAKAAAKAADPDYSGATGLQPVSWDNKGYNLVWNNCEHFAIWCKTGIAESKQVQYVLNTIFRYGMFTKIIRS